MSSYVYICGVCSKEVGKKAPSIVCKSCLNWIHLSKCTKLSYKDAKRLENTYHCSSCERNDVKAGDKDQKKDDGESSNVEDVVQTVLDILQSSYILLYRNHAICDPSPYSIR